MKTAGYPGPDSKFSDSKFTGNSLEFTDSKFSSCYSRLNLVTSFGKEEAFNGLKKTFKYDDYAANPVIKLYVDRWLVILIYVFAVNSNVIQIMQYSVIADIAVEYYQVPYVSIDWTSMIVSLVGAVFCFPGNYAAEKLGLRISMIIGTVGTCAATWIKLAAVEPNRFWLVLLSQGLLAAFMSLSGSLLPKIAATWFGARETSKACAIGLVGVQLGFALSFLIPPLVVDRSSIAGMELSIYNISLAFSIYSSVMAILVILFFKNEPPLPPSVAQDNLLKEKISNPTTIFRICKNLITNKPYILYMITNSINMGVVNATQILSNQVILMYYPDAYADVGIIGLLQTFLSLLGSISASVVLDKYKKFKITSWIAYGLYFLTIVLYVATLDQGLPYVYVTSILNGILMGTILTLTMEVVVEFTYGEPENISVGMVTTFGQIITIGATFLYGHMFRTVGINWANVTVVLIMFASNLLFFLIKFDLKREAVQTSAREHGFS